MWWQRLECTWWWEGSGGVIRGKENRSYYEIVSSYTAVKMGKDEFQRMSLSKNATIE